MIRIGSWHCGLRTFGRKKFHWFYKPLLKSTMERERITIWWFGWHFYVCHDKKLEGK